MSTQDKMWLREYFTISQIEGSVNTNTFPTACSAGESAMLQCVGDLYGKGPSHWEGVFL